jgi:hypothetical protein
MRMGVEEEEEETQNKNTNFPFYIPSEDAKK